MGDLFFLEELVSNQQDLIGDALKEVEEHEFAEEEEKELAKIELARVEHDADDLLFKIDQLEQGIPQDPPGTISMTNFSRFENIRTLTEDFKRSVDRAIHFTATEVEQLDQRREDMGPLTKILITDAKTLNIGKAKKPADIIGKAIKVIMSIVGSIALVMFVYAGGLWMVAGGNAQQTTKAMKTMVWSAIGLIVILSSYSIVNFIFSNTF